MLRYIFLAVYLLAVNIYGFILVRSLRESALERRGTAAKKAKVLLAGALGGALADMWQCLPCGAARTTRC